MADESSSEKIDVLSFGEALVDFLPDQPGPLQNVGSFERVVGGAPANLTVGLARLDRDAALMGKVGIDQFGAYLMGQLEDEGVEITGITQTEEAKTGLTFVSLDDDGERSFLFYREPSADVVVDEEDVDEQLISRATFFQVGSNLLNEPRPRAATLHALELADEHECIISCDPNIRLHMWPHPDEARRMVLRSLNYAHIVKVNEQEFDFLGDGDTVRGVWENIFHARNVLALIITRGELGAEVITSDLRASADAPRTDVVDTTGAGDGFLSGLLTAMLENGIDDNQPVDATNFEALMRDWDEKDWQRMLETACA